MESTASSKPLYKSLYFQVITAIVLGVLLGHFWPETGAAMKPLGDGFIKLIKMIIAPIIFCTVVVGIAGMEDMKKVGKTGGLALLYFEIVSSIALIVGLVIINIVQPGAGSRHCGRGTAGAQTRCRNGGHRPAQRRGSGALRFWRGRASSSASATAQAVRSRPRAWRPQAPAPGGRIVGC